MAKLTAHGYEVLNPGRYVLEVVEAEAVNEYGPQLRLRLRVAEGEHQGILAATPALVATQHAQAVRGLFRWDGPAAAATVFRVLFWSWAAAGVRRRRA